MQKDYKNIERVKDLRNKGKSFREIARLLRKDVKSVYRWHRAGLTDTDNSSGIANSG